MEYVKGRLKEYTIKLEEVAKIFSQRMGVKSFEIYFCEKADNKIACYRVEVISDEAKKDIEDSFTYFKNNKNNKDNKKVPIYKGCKFFVTDTVNCLNYLDGKFIVAIYLEIEDTDNELLYEYFKRQIERFLLYIAPMIYYNLDLYPEFLLDGQMCAVTKTLIEEQIKSISPNTLNLQRIKAVNYFSIIDQLSKMTYEGEYLKNKCLVFAQNQRCDVELLCKSIEFGEIKKVRKLLEITNADENNVCLGLLCDTLSMNLKGFISSNEITTDYVMVVFEGKGRWSITCKNGDRSGRLSIVDSSIHFSKKEIDEEKFKNIFKNEFKNGKVDLILNFVKKATLQKHGTMVVILESAKQEMKRLSNTGYEVKYTREIENKYIEQITAIDGSVMMSSDGEIVGIGVILDGESSAECNINSSRGARYNSAIKYTYSRKQNNEKCIAVVVSEDGDVNFIVDGEQM